MKPIDPTGILVFLLLIGIFWITYKALDHEGK
jgi:hypothetical protein